ncbi:polyprenyl synthetase family protein [Amycolatopsis acidicola]|uniref:Polyprenyl synthetase family protein n=1 Tax=Amycolatopsis acidicola TaxID=2596893 RepID=A0A5N0UJ38_9PSEU|nr:polyprenyl synthetase family protein [Amycolatopsis acidicola]KAA9149068.1 polyprenyl synthetase family protein [Amycolatopsis acidicola]
MSVDVATPARTAPEILSWSRDLVEPELRSATARLSESVKPPTYHHFGWTDGGGSGKVLRPAMALLSAEAVGSAPEPALPAAVTVELVHNFSLLHDDVVDGDATRRHRATVWKVFGVGTAILAGDALLALAAELLAERPAQLRILMIAVADLIEGQCADLRFEDRDDVDVAECRDMAKGKTAALLGASCAMGAVAGGGGREQIRQLRSFGEEIGLAFQFVDDLLGIWGEQAVTGKPVYSDLRNRKKSLPVVAALRSGTREGRQLAQLYGKPDDLTSPELARAAELVEGAGGRRWAQEQADQLLEKALSRLHAAVPRPRAEAELTALARLVARRDR